MKDPGFAFVLAAACSQLAGALGAQCTPAAVSYGGTPGPDGYVNASTLWDPDGSGPLGQHLVVAGAFLYADAVAARNIALLDPATGQWSALGGGLGTPSFTGSTGDTVHALQVLPGGELVAAGTIAPFGHAARWNGTAWVAISAGLPGPVTGMTLAPSGELVAVGTSGGPAWQAFVVRFDAPTATWTPVVPPPLNVGGALNAVAVLPNGDLVVAGQFTSAGGVPALNIARYDGVAWHALGSGVDTRALTLHVRGNGDLIVGGMFGTAGGVPVGGIARWDGSNWSAFGSGLLVGFMLNVSSLLELPNGDLVAAGAFPASGALVVNCIARWDGASWHAFGPGFLSENGYPTVKTVARLPNGDLAAGGTMMHSDGRCVGTIARWDGTAWTRLGGGTSAIVHSLCTAANGDVIAGGDFRVIGGVDALFVARRTGTTWQPLGGGVNAAVRAVTALPNGDVVVGGMFTAAGGQAAMNVARWDGSQWHAMAGGTNGAVLALAASPTGDVIAAGTFTLAGNTTCRRIARWNGATWLPLDKGLGGDVLAIAVAPDGAVMAGGTFASPGLRLARWNGTAWTGLSAIGNSVSAIAALPDGSFVADRRRWNGTTPTPFAAPEGILYTIQPLANGDLLFGGSLTVGGSNANLARWNGTTASVVHAGTRPVRALALRPDGEWVAGGDFRELFGTVAAHVASVPAACPATADVVGAGCGSPPTGLVAESLPWLGTGARSRATAVATGSLAFAIFGLSPLALPLPPVLGTPAPGCSLLASPDLVLFPTGAVGADPAWVVSLPAAIALVGQSFHQQAIARRPDGTLTSSNAVHWRLGAP